MNNKGMKQSTKLSLDLISTIIVTLIAGAVTVAAVISMAWFASNSQTGTTGNTVTVGRERYTISFLGGSTNGIYYDDIHTIVKDPSAIVWGMTATNNLENGTEWNESARTGDRGVYPGSSGVITFFITPHVEDVALEFDFELVGYFYKDTDNDSSTEDVLVKISEEGETFEKAADTLLNGHLLFFEKADPKTETDGTVYYDDFEDPLLPTVSGTKVIRTLTGRVFGDEDEELEVAERVDLYWTWPYSLSKLVDATSCTMISVTETPFIKDYNTTNTADYTALVENIRQYPDFYMKGVTRPVTYNSATSEPTEEQMASEYVLYGDYYDQGDNEIGMTVGYVLLKMTIREVEPESGE